MLGGILVTVALVLPGISATHMLYILGMYELVMELIATFQWHKLVPLLIGVLLGIVVSSRLLEYLLRRYPSLVYMIIIGFVAGSVVSLIPIKIQHPIIGAGFWILGCMRMYLLSKRAVIQSKQT